MTNFDSSLSPKKRLITPERAVVVLPILAGTALAVLLGLFLFSPLLVQLNQRRSLVQAMERKREELPLLRQQLQTLLERQQSLQAQQARLLNLVAGTTALKTWLAQLNRLALSEDIAILQVEPQPVEVFVPPPPQTDSTGSSVVVTPQSGDPLLAPGIEKRSAVVTLQGRFVRLVSLLQKIELLQVIALASDLELDLAPQNPDSKELKIRLKLKLSAYGRSAKASS